MKDMRWQWLLFLVIILGFGFWYISNLGKTPTSQTSTVTPITTEATSTYTNNQYGFAFDYPKTYGTSTMEFTGKDGRDPSDPLARFDGTLSPIGMTVEVDEKPSNFKNTFFEQQFALEKKEPANNGFQLSTTTVQIGGTTGFQIEGMGKGLIEREILIPHDIYIFSIGYTVSSTSPETVLDPILSTFRFTR